MSGQRSYVVENRCSDKNSLQARMWQLHLYVVDSDDDVLQLAVSTPSTRFFQENGNVRSLRRSLRRHEDAVCMGYYLRVRLSEARIGP